MSIIIIAVSINNSSTVCYSHCKSTFDPSKPVTEKSIKTRMGYWFSNAPTVMAFLNSYCQVVCLQRAILVLNLDLITHKQFLMSNGNVSNEMKATA